MRILGLTSWKNSPNGKIKKSDVATAKNYLTADELKPLNRIVTMYLDYAEDQAEQGNVMTMKDWSEHLDRILTMSGESLLTGAGSISHEKALEKATTEYKIYQQKTLSEAEKNYLESFKELEKKIK